MDRNKALVRYISETFKSDNGDVDSIISEILDGKEISNISLNNVKRAILEYINSDDDDYYEIDVVLYSDNIKASGRARGFSIGSGENRRVIFKSAPGDNKYKTFFRDEVVRVFENKYGKIELLSKKEIMVDMRIYKPIPKSKSVKDKILMELGIIKNMTKPDVDNYVKIHLDALNGYLWHDDSQVTSCNCEKFYSIEPRVEMNIKICR